MISKYFCIILFTIIASCQTKDILDSKLEALSYFDEIEAASIRIESTTNGLASNYFLNGDLKGKAEWKNLPLFDDYFIKAPINFDVITKEINDKLVVMRNSKRDRIIFNIIDYDSPTALGAFKGLYQYSQENNIDFRINSAKYIESINCNYLVYSVTTNADENTTYNLGFLYTNDSLNYIDISYSQEREFLEYEKIMFIDIINSLKNGEGSLIPNSQSIRQIIDVEI